MTGEDDFVAARHGDWDALAALLDRKLALHKLPPADIALSVCLVHHLSEADVINLIRNASKSCRRLILLEWRPPRTSRCCACRPSKGRW